MRRPLRDVALARSGDKGEHANIGVWTHDASVYEALRSELPEGVEPAYDASSTDANIPISRGIPSMCIGLTSGGNVHRVDEYIRIPPIATGFTQLLLDTVLATEALSRGDLPRQVPG